MSIQALNWALDQRVGSGVRKLILLLIANRADEAHSCYPGTELLVWESELGASTIDNAIRDLVKMGLLRVLRRAKKRGGRRTNRYQLLVDGPDTPPPPVDDWVSEYTPRDKPSEDGDGGGGGGEGDGAGEGAGDDGEPGDGAGAAADETAASGKPLGARGLVDGDGGGADTADETAGQPKPLGARSLGKPLGARDTNSSERGVSIGKPKGVNPQIPPPPYGGHPDDGAGAAEEEEAARRRLERLEAARNILRAVTAKVPPERLPQGHQAARLVDVAASVLELGWDTERLRRRLGDGSLDKVGSVYAVLHSRLTALGPPPAREVAAEVPRPPWCGRCNSDTRLDVDDQDKSVPCERCHPAR